jgi:hypothetical protein
MRGFGWLAVLALLVIGLIGGAVGYNVGLNIGAQVGGAPVAYPAYGWGFGFPFFGLIFFIILVLIVVGIVRRAAWSGHRGSGPVPYWMHRYGRHGWGEGQDSGPDEMLQRWHRQAHGEPVPTEPDRPTNQAG